MSSEEIMSIEDAAAEPGLNAPALGEVHPAQLTGQPVESEEIFGSEANMESLEDIVAEQHAEASETLLDSWNKTKEEGLTGFQHHPDVSVVHHRSNLLKGTKYELRSRIMMAMLPRHRHSCWLASSAIVTRGTVRDKILLLPPRRTSQSYCCPRGLGQILFVACQS